LASFNAQCPELVFLTQICSIVVAFSPPLYPAGPAFGCDHNSAGAKPPAASLDRARIHETRAGADDGTAEAGETLLGIVRRNSTDDAMDVVVNLAEVEAGWNGQTS
jgi:hypothetical protein